MRPRDVRLRAWQRKQALLAWRDAVIFGEGRQRLIIHRSTGRLVAMRVPPWEQDQPEESKATLGGLLLRLIHLRGLHVGVRVPGCAHCDEEQI